VAAAWLIKRLTGSMIFPFLVVGAGRRVHNIDAAASAPFGHLRESLTVAKDAAWLWLE
jgi:hypothetical protein